MTTNFPSGLDAFTNPSATDAMDSVTVPHASQHADLNDAVEALQAKVGVDGSAVTTSLDYKVDALETTNGNLISGATYYYTNNSQYAPEYGSNYYRSNLYTISAPSGKSISSIQLTTRSSAPAWVTITAQSSSSYSYYVWSKGASTGYVNYFLDCR